MIDRTAKGWVTSPELTEALGDLGLYSHKEDVYLFLRRYDRDSDGRLLYSDFCDAFTPKAFHHA
jgi:Ca2+-binding EF-hand superfamily protein